MFEIAQPLVLSLEEFQKMARIVFFNLQMEKLRLGNAGGLAGGLREIAIELPGAGQAMRDLELIQ